MKFKLVGERSPSTRNVLNPRKHYSLTPKIVVRQQSQSLIYSKRQNQSFQLSTFNNQKDSFDHLKYDDIF